MNIKPIKKSFTLIEVLVASSILFIVSAAVVGLSNSIIQGTSVTADSATANRLATEGLELITKIRDDNLKNASFESGKFIWLDEVEFSNEYGWYTLDETSIGTNIWELTRSSDYNDPILQNNTIVMSSFNMTGAVSELVGLVDYHKLICIEAVGAVNDQEEGILSCNTAAERTLMVDDGNRNSANPGCYDEGTVGEKDIFCLFTKDSLNKNRLGEDKRISDGNAVKIRSVVLWNDKDNYRVTEVATILTNWQSFAR